MRGFFHLFFAAGVVHSIEGVEEIASMENVSVDLSKRPGAKVAPGANIGLVRIYAGSVEEEIEKLKKVNELLDIRDENGDGMFVRYTDYRARADDFNAELAE